MRAFPRATASAICIQLALGLFVAAPLGAAQQPQPNDLPVSLERIRDELEVAVPSRLKLDMPVEKPIAKFRTRVDQTVYVLTLDEWIDKEFNLIGIQRQSADWASKCCGIGLDPLFKVSRTHCSGGRSERSREQIARELAELEAARKAARLTDER